MILPALASLSDASQKIIECIFVTTHRNGGGGKMKKNGRKGKREKESMKERKKERKG